MNEHPWLAESFEGHRARLQSVAYRMLGSTAEAEDAVQEAWLRLSRAGADGVQNLGGWLTTVVARVCLDMLRARESRREAPLDEAPPVGDDALSPEQEVVLGESVGLALLVVLETLAPAERVAFVLHDLFGVPFDEVATVVARSPEATRQLASRARRRVRGASATGEVDADRQHAIVGAFLAASRGGDFGALLALLDPEVVLRADPAVVATGGAVPEVRGAEAVARQFAGRAQAAEVALLDGEAGLVWAPGGRPRVAFVFQTAGGKVVGIELVGDAGRLAAMGVVRVGEA